MPNSVKVPELGESITEAIVATWLKQPGDALSVDEPIVELETDKITVEVPAPTAGVLTKQMAEEGDTVNVGDVIAEIDENAKAESKDDDGEDGAPVQEAADASSSRDKDKDKDKDKDEAKSEKSGGSAMPAARAEGGRSGVDVSKVEGSGRGGRVLKEDVQKAAQKQVRSPRPDKPDPSKGKGPPNTQAPNEPERREKMSSLRKRIASRLVQAQAEAAILTTFNECDMSGVMKLRSEYKQAFIDAHDVKLGFMSFFIKAAVAALQAYPAVNAEIDGEELIYYNRYDIGVAVGGGKGLVVPVIRNADQLSFAEIEKEILRLAGLAKNNKLAISDLTGGTFTISNGGVYGSMLSTPILNPPQTGILGLHNIVERPVALDGEVVIRPVMYLALSYDHRIVDGREAVGFLVKIKEAIEDPRRLLIEV